MKAKCDYCEGEAIGWMLYEGLHQVCRRHKRVIEELAKKGLQGTDFQEELEKTKAKGTRYKNKGE